MAPKVSGPSRAHERYRRREPFVPSVPDVRLEGTSLCWVEAQCNGQNEVANGTVPNGPICESRPTARKHAKRGVDEAKNAQGKGLDMAQYSDLPVRLAVVGEFGAKQGRDMPGTWLVASCTGRYTTYLCSRYREIRASTQGI